VEKGFHEVVREIRKRKKIQGGGSSADKKKKGGFTCTLV
jgi:hypothetical protein